MALPRSIRHPLRRFAQVEPRRRALVVEAVLFLAMARLALIIIPFAAFARHLGTAAPPRKACAASSSEAAQHARDIGWAVTRAARYLPFRAVCLPQAIAARIMLRRRGIASVLHVGAALDGQRIDAHAWLDAEGVEVTGYPVAPRYAELACYV